MWRVPRAPPAAVPRLAGHSGFPLLPGCTQLGGGLGRAEEEVLAASPQLPDTVSHPVPGFSGDAVCHPAPRRRRPVAGPHMPPGTGSLEGEAAAALPDPRSGPGSREGDGCMIRGAGRCRIKSAEKSSDFFLISSKNNCLSAEKMFEAPFFIPARDAYPEAPAFIVNALAWIPGSSPGMTKDIWALLYH